MPVLCHIAGPSGSGKTTILHKIHSLYLTILVKDLDDFDDEGSRILNLDSVQKKHWNDDNLLQLAKLRQKLMDEFLYIHQEETIVLAGFHTEDAHTLHIPTESRFLLDTDAETSAKRAFERSQDEKIEHRRKIEDMELDIADAQKEIDFLLSQGYEKKSEEEILEFVKENVQG
jgi:adenylate kinase family enzyme